MKRRILYVAMHLSTGGSPQWLLELIKESMIQSEVFVVEFSRYSANYTVQRNKILNLIGKKNFASLGYYNSGDYNEEKTRLLDIIRDFNPDIIHFNEVPENFEYKGFDSQILQEIFKRERSYKILETCHDNSFDFSSKSIWPDAFVAVSEFQKNKLETLGRTFYLWDYEIPEKERPNREKTLRALGLDPNRKHILNVGLFHANKNQKYIYDLASKLLDLVGLSIEFHFVGNECYKDSCGIDNLDLLNCRIWGERADVDTFYSCMDLFLFPSIRELNPLCVKEALSWGMPVIMNKIEACDIYKKYENNPSVKFIQDINVEHEIMPPIEPKEVERKKDLRFAIYTSFYNTGWNAKNIYQDLLNQTYSNWKWFIADDFSMDDTRQTILDITSKDERVIFCEQKHKREMYWNSQKFIAEDCDYVISCDSDDGMYPKALSVYNHMLSLNPDMFSFSCWHHQYLGDINDKKNIANCDFSFCEGDWYNFLSRIEKDLEKGGFDWGYVRSHRVIGGLRCYKNSPRIEKVNVKNPEQSIYEDSIRTLHFQRYGDFMMFPRPLYKLFNNEKSESKTDNIGSKKYCHENSKEDVHKLSKSNYLNYLKDTEPYQHHKISDKYTKYFDELCSLNLSSLHHETERKNISLITNKNIAEEEKANIQDLYFDHDFYVNEYEEKIDYYFLFLNSFSDEELLKTFNKFKGQKGSFEVNCYCLLDEPDKTEKDIQRINSVCLGEPFSWNVFCRNLTVKFNYKKKEREKALVQFKSRSLGDSLGWIPYVEEFRKQNDCDVYCFTFNNALYEKSYPEIKFISDIEECHGFDKTYNIGWLKDTPREVKRKNLQYTASYYLNLEHKEIKPRVDIKNKKRTIEGKYVCIAVQSTAQAKYWNNPKGWEQTVKYLNSLGYSVVCIDKHSSFGKDEKMNFMPNGVIDKTGDLPLQDRITDIYNCEFFIGLGSGLSWLAWALGKEVILISGFSDPESEFYTPYRVINREVCNSCWNKEEFDKGNWNWCPYHEGAEREFECSKEITFEMVKKQIDRLL